MSYSQFWFIGTQAAVSGATPIQGQIRHGLFYPPESLAFICPTCGEVWARRLISPNTPWRAISRDCEKHPTGYNRVFEPAGSLWLAYDPEYCNSLPKEILAREAKLRLGEDNSELSDPLNPTT